MRVAFEKAGPRLAVGLLVLGVATGGLTSTAAAAPRAAAPATTAAAQADGHWVSAWSAAPQGVSTLGNLGVETLSGDTQVQLVQHFLPPIPTFNNETIRQIMYMHHDGNMLRVKLSNQYGHTPTTLPSVTIGKRTGGGADVAAGTQRTLTVNGKPSVTIPAGGTVLTDPIAMPVKAFDHLVLSIFAPAGNPPATVHGNAMQTSYVGAGDLTHATSGSGFGERGLNLVPLSSTLTTAAYYATGIEVRSTPTAKTLVLMGDSITDGFESTANTDRRYPDYLARRIQANPATRNLSVTNQAISAGRVTANDVGPSGLNRLQSQVFDAPNVAGVIYLEGINDLGNTLFQDRLRYAEELIAGYKEFAARVHAHGLPVYIGTLTPAGNLLRPTPFGMYSTPPAVAARNQVNNWLRTEGRKYFDGVVDYDAAVRNPAIPDWIDFKYDALDNLHPNDAGYELMANSIPQAWLNKMAK